MGLIGQQVVKDPKELVNWLPSTVAQTAWETSLAKIPCHPEFPAAGMAIAKVYEIADILPACGGEATEPERFGSKLTPHEEVERSILNLITHHKRAPI